MVKKGKETGWLSGEYICLECYETQISVFPVSCDDNHLECNHCGAMDGRITKYYDKQSKGR